MSDEELNLKELLDEIIEKKGPYKREPLEHAESVMEKASLNAQKLKQELTAIFEGIMKEGENGESTDCACSARYWYYQLKGEPVPKEWW
jgi:hypothetical protein